MANHNLYPERVAAVIRASERLGDDYYKTVSAWIAGGRSLELRPACFAAALLFKQSLEIQIEYLGSCRDLDTVQRRIRLCNELIEMVDGDLQCLDGPRGVGSTLVVQGLPRGNPRH